MIRPSARALRSGAFALLVLAAWLFVPRSEEVEPDRPAARVVLVDASASVRRPFPDWIRWTRDELRREAEAALAAGDELCVIGVAEEVRVRFGPSNPDDFLGWLEGRDGRAPFDPAADTGSDAGTRFVAGLTATLEVVCEDGRLPGSVVLLGDGRAGDGDPRPLIGRLFQQGARVDWRPPPPPEVADVGLSNLVLPRSVEAGAPLHASVEISFVSGRRPVERLVLSVLLDEEGVQRQLQHTVELADRGRSSARWVEPIPLGAAGLGRTVLTVEARIEPGPDPVPENDRLQGSYKGEGSLVIGVVADESKLDFARRAFTPSGVSALTGLEFVYRTPEELGASLGECDALVSFDLPMGELPQALVEAFVEGGAGLLVTSGWRFLGDWVPGVTPDRLQEILPMSPESSESPPRDVVLLVDGSGSMEGGPFDMVRAASIALVGAALPSDRLILRFFTTRLEREILLRERFDPLDPDRDLGGQAVAERLLGARVPGGQTMILRSLKAFAGERGEGANQSLILLLSDGRERDTLARPADSARETLALLAKAGAELFVIAVGDDYDEAFLHLLVPEGEGVAHAQSLSDLEAVFRRSIGGARVREGDIGVQVTPSAPDSLAREVLGTTNDESLPGNLQQLVRNVLRPGAELLWQTPEGEPVLAAWRVGAGRAALFSSAIQPGWAPAWMDPFGRGEPRAFGPLLRWLARSPSAGTGDAPELLVDGRRLVVSGLAPGTELSPLLRLFDVSGELANLRLGPELRSSGASAVGVRVGELPEGLEADGQGLSALLELPDGGRVLRVTRAAAAEFRPNEGDGARLAALLEKGPSGLQNGPGARSESAKGHPAAPWVLLFGLLSLFAGFLGGDGRQGIGGSGR